ncbi:MAG: GDP-fucose synthetase [Acidobacteria bacterium]|nr:GDP-fucose synthetase [Acidobacteriota bacterium]
MKKDSKIYIAGHTGLLGSALIKKLGQKGFNNIITRTHKELDLTRYDEVKLFFRKNKPEYVFLAAGKTGGIIANRTYPYHFLHVNIAIQNNIFEVANEYNVKHLVFYGSSCIYPRLSSQPIKETDLFSGKIEESSEGYAVAKIAGLIACKAYNTQFNANRFIALVPNTMFGPNDHYNINYSHVLPSLITRFHIAKENKAEKIVLWGSGTPRREFIFSEDVADASIFAVKHSKKLENKYYNVGTGFDISIEDLANMIASAVGYSGKIYWDKSMPEGAPRKLLDSNQFMSLGWKHSVTLEEGLSQAYQWFLNVNEKSKESL